MLELSACECTLWSIACTTLDPEQKAEGRRKQGPTLKWLSDRVKARAAKRRHSLVENPWSSAIWRESPLQALLNDFPLKKTNQCSFGAADDEGLPIRKETGMLTTFPLRQCIRPCTCTKPHSQLKGTITAPADNDSGSISLPKTSLAMVYPHRFVDAMIADAIKMLDRAEAENYWSCPKCKNPASSEPHSFRPSQCARGPRLMPRRKLDTGPQGEHQQKVPKAPKGKQLEATPEQVRQ